MTTISSEIKPSRVADSSLYRGGISGRYIKERLVGYQTERVLVPECSSRVTTS